jgi:2-iminobutanoate/2-iminopropanoate deaminase
MLSTFAQEGDTNMQRRDINAPDAPTPNGYTQAVEVSGVARTLYMSGQIGVSATGTTPTEFATQCQLVWANIEAQLRAAGMSLDDVVKMTTILPDLANIDELRRIRTEVLGARRPASTLVVGGLANPLWKVEIEIIACA